MRKANNTEVEFQKLEYTIQHVNANGLDSKDTFVTQALK